jgi:hypothetical protein
VIGTEKENGGIVIFFFLNSCIKLILLPKKSAYVSYPVCVCRIFHLGAEKPFHIGREKLIPLLIPFTKQCTA